MSKILLYMDVDVYICIIYIYMYLFHNIINMKSCSVEIKTTENKQTNRRLTGFRVHDEQDNAGQKGHKVRFSHRNKVVVAVSII